MRIFFKLALAALLASSLLVASCYDDETPPAEEYTTQSETEVYGGQPNATDQTEEQATEPMKERDEPAQPEEGMGEESVQPEGEAGDEQPADERGGLGMTEEREEHTPEEGEQMNGQNRTEI
ncbi:hypothetical protein DPQ33_03210 [Oceanidesulfovibrio indonesiensis]|uniref:Secreted protein n=1 Tax=Oceanidesulfovibrio indonesiensis TaxID=54767 RepID=A0A7M3MI70_9BACT|nr:hypothetical protein [Oceanidesulfovibrio indonesiensis]TVM19383.1 hypothetical protein DPQ33_03210 [Oceanidesulfovibrio indonesiensis]